MHTSEIINIVSAYKVGEKTFGSFEEAQVTALANVFCALNTDRSTQPSEIAGFIIEHKDEILTILTMKEPTPKARKPRSDQGKPHRKKKAVAANPEPAPIESTVEGSGKYSGK